MSCTILHMSSLFYIKETLLGCPNLSFIMTTASQSITTMIWLPLQIKNPNCLAEAMLLIVLSPDPKCRQRENLFSRSWIWKMDLENRCIISVTKEPKLKGAKYVRECYARKCLQLKKQQAQFGKFINQAND